MGRLSRLKRLGRTGTPDEDGYKPLCPYEHDPISLSRIASKDRAVWAVAKAGQIAGGSKDEVEGMIVAIAMRKHDSMCARGKPGDKYYCSCEWCTQRRESLQSTNLLNAG